VSKSVIFNADDFGASPGVNGGIVEAHVETVVTSTSLMATGAAAREPGALAARHPALSVGLRWVGEARLPELDTGDERAVAGKLECQLKLFGELGGHAPARLDSHHHLHREEHLLPAFGAAGEWLRVPLGGDGPGLLRDEVLQRWTEIICHLGFVGEGLDTVYWYERELEFHTLTDPRLGKALDDLDIALRSYRAWAEATG